MIVHYKGELQKEENVKLGLSNRAFLYGDGVFESLRVWNGRVMLWEDHYFRLMSSMRISRMEIPENYTPEYLIDCVHQTVDANGLENCRVRITVFREGSGKHLPKETEIQCLIQLESVDEALYPLNEKGYEIDLYQDQYKMSGVHSGIKTVNSQLYVMASIFAQENNLEEVLLINEHKSVVEGSKSNIFIFHNGQLRTPALTEGCVKGVMRKNFIEFLEKKKIELTEDRISPFELIKADEIWLTNAISGLQWVSKYRKKEFGNEQAQIISAQFREYLSSKEDLWER